MYTFESRVRYSETDAKGRLTPEKLIDYFQDCSTFQSEELGVGISCMQARRLAWMVVYWRVEIHRLPVLGEQIRIGTLPYEMKGGIGLRNFLLETPAGERLAAANSVWTLISTDTMHPVRVPSDILERYRLEKRLDMQYDSRKIRIPDRGGQEMPPVIVKEYHLDSNRHMNNGQYVRIAAGYLPPDTETAVLRIAYMRQAVLGDRITPVVFQPEEAAADDCCRKVCISLNSDDGTPFAALVIHSPVHQKKAEDVLSRKCCSC